MTYFVDLKLLTYNNMFVSIDIGLKKPIHRVYTLPLIKKNTEINPCFKISERFLLSLLIFFVRICN